MDGDEARSRTFFAFVLAPLAPGLTISVIVLADSVLRPGPTIGIGIAGQLSGWLWLMGALALVAYPVTILFGAPIYYLLRRKRWNGWLVYLFVGVCLGILGAWLVVLFSGHVITNLGDFFRTYSGQSFLGVCSGSSAAIAFWLIARPDRERSGLEKTSD